MIIIVENTSIKSGTIIIVLNTKAHILHLLTGYDGHSTFIIPKVPTIFGGNAEDNSWYRGDI
jgi:hypothetical protein